MKNNSLLFALTAFGPAGYFMFPGRPESLFHAGKDPLRARTTYFSKNPAATAAGIKICAFTGAKLQLEEA